MWLCKDPFLAVLKKFGYNVVRLPRTDLPPLHLLGGRGSELDRMGELTTVLLGDNPPPVRKDAASVTITGEQSRTSDLGLKLGLSLLGNVIAAMGGSRVGLEAQYKTADTVSFEFVDVLEDSVEAALLDQYLSRAKIHPDARQLARMLGRGEIYVVTSVIKSRKLVVRAKSSGSGTVAVDVPAVSQLVGGSLKVSSVAGQDAALQYEGPVPLVFGFQAVRLRFRDGEFEGFERLAPGAAAARSIEPVAGIGPREDFADLSGPGTPFARFARDPSTGEADRRALLIGINEYPKLPFSAQLRGCVADVELMAATLTSVFGFPPANVRVMTNAEARRDAILAALDRLVSETGTEDAVVIQFSGHGSRVRDREGDEPDGWDETIVPTDSGREGAEVRDITDDEIYSRLLALSTKTGNITLLFDCCHSGTITRDPFGGAARGIAPAAPDAPLPEASLSPAALIALRGARDADRGPAGTLPIDRDYVLLAGCRDEEKSYEHTVPGADGAAATTHGALTYFLHRELIAAGPGATYRDVFDAARRQVTARYPTQQPQMVGGADRVLFGTARREPMPFLPVNAVAGTTVTLGGGAAHAVTVGSVWAVYPPDTKHPDPTAALGRVTITSVGAVTATGTADAPGASAITAGCRATEELRAAADPRMSVEVTDLTGTAAPDDLRALLNAHKLLKAVPSGGDVRVYAVPPGAPPSRQEAVPALGELAVATWAAVGQDGQLIGTPVAVSEPGALNHLVENLATVSRFRNTLALTNPAPNNPLTGAVQLTLLRKNAAGDWVEAAPELDGRIVFAEGEPCRLRFTNTTTSRLFVTALDFGLSYGVSQIFPPPEAQPALQPGRYEYPPAGDPPIELYFPAVFPAGVNEGVETVKLLVTTEPADFRWFQQDGVRSADAPTSVLEAAMELAARGTRDARVPAANKTTNWTTVERSFTLRRTAGS